MDKRIILGLLAILISFSFESSALTLTQNGVGSDNQTLTVNTTLTDNFKFTVGHDGSTANLNLPEVSIVSGICSTITQFTCVDDSVNKEVTITIPVEMLAEISGKRRLDTFFNFVDTIDKEFQVRRITQSGSDVSTKVFNHGDLFTFNI